MLWPHSSHLHSLQAIYRAACKVTAFTSFLLKHTESQLMFRSTDPKRNRLLMSRTHVSTFWKSLSPNKEKEDAAVILSKHMNQLKKPCPKKVFFFCFCNKWICAPDSALRSTPGLHFGPGFVFALYSLLNKSTSLVMFPTIYLLMIFCCTSLSRPLRCRNWIL